MGYLSEHYYKLMKTVPSSDGKNTALRVSYQRDRIKSWWLDEEMFIDQWAKPAIEKVIDEEIEQMLDEAFSGSITLNLNVSKWK